jgi:hypothetical protein
MDTQLRFDDVDLPADSVAQKLWHEQKEHFQGQRLPTL